MKEKQKILKNLKKQKKHILATPGLEPTTWSDDNSTTKLRNIYEWPRNLWQYELSAVSPDRAD